MPASIVSACTALVEAAGPLGSDQSSMVLALFRGDLPAQIRMHHIRVVGTALTICLTGRIDIASIGLLFLSCSAAMSKMELGCEGRDPFECFP
eukprot:2684604-Karenia_brevis.AAC.1